MKFTVVFNSSENSDYSFGLVFVPSPIWVIGEKEIINLNPQNPQYQIGGVRKLIDKVDLNTKLRGQERKCTVVLHESGYGTTKDLESLKEDLTKEGFKVKTFAL